MLKKLLTIPLYFQYMVLYLGQFLDKILDKKFPYPF